MPITIHCKCGHEAKVPDALAGKRILCDECRRPVEVPGESGRAKARAPDDERPIGQVKARGRRGRRVPKEERATPSRTPLWIALGVGGATALAAVITLVIVLTRPAPETPANPQGPAAAAPSGPAPVTPVPVTEADASKTPPAPQ